MAPCLCGCPRGLDCVCGACVFSWGSGRPHCTMVPGGTSGSLSSDYGSRLTQGAQSTASRELVKPRTPAPWAAILSTGTLLPTQGHRRRP